MLLKSRRCLVTFEIAATSMQVYKYNRLTIAGMWSEQGYQELSVLVMTRVVSDLKIQDNLQ